MERNQHFICFEQGSQTVVLHVLTPQDKEAATTNLIELFKRARTIETETIKRAAELREKRFADIEKMMAQWEEDQPSAKIYREYREEYKSWEVRHEEHHSKNTGLPDKVEEFEAPPKCPLDLEDPGFIRRLERALSPKPAHSTIPEAIFDGTVVSAFRDVITVDLIEEAISGTVAALEFENTSVSIVDCN